MLVLTRRVNEIVRIGDDVIFQILGIKGCQVRLGIDAPKNIAVHREEIYQRILEVTRKGAIDNLLKNGEENK